MAVSGEELVRGRSMEDLVRIMNKNPSFKGYAQGYFAEDELESQLVLLDGVTSVTKIPDRSAKKGDYLVVYLGKEISVEVKSLSSYAIREDLLNGGWTGRISMKRTDAEVLNDEGEKTYCVVKGEFDVLAICTFSLTKQWDFQFIANKYLPTSDQYQNRLASSVTINTLNTPKLTPNPLEVFAEI